MYTLDTNIIIYHFHNDLGVREFMNSVSTSSTPIYISAITIAELLRFPDLSVKEEVSILELLPMFSIIPFDLQIAKEAGLFGRKYNLKLADSIIAATTLFTNSTLVTRNIKDFKKIPNLSLLKI